MSNRWKPRPAAEAEARLAIGICVVAAIYYLVWKYFVNFLNGVMGIA